MRADPTPLPIDASLPRLTAALEEGTAAVLVAPPGAGKTTRVPLVLAQASWVRGRKLLLLEPRRLAARAAAARMAATLGEQVGETIGLRVRFGSKVSRRTRIEILTEGVFTRLVLDDPSLEGVAGVLFDEFHERSLDADLGLALALDAKRGLREDLRLVAMSATLDGARVAALLGAAAVIESAGRAYPVETRYIGRDPRVPIERQVADATVRGLRANPGSALVFLPGAAEIRRAQALLVERLAGETIDVLPLFGALEGDAQDRAIAPPAPGRRKVVLATSIAETSLTIEGVRIVIDSGLARVPRYEPDVGLTRLETVRVSRAAADQRRGRAGRTEPGTCYRLWEEAQTAALEPYTRPEILSADLSGFVLDLAHWGVTEPATLAFPDPPPDPAVAEAKTLLRDLGALDEHGRITAEGRRLRALPLPPRLARMVVDATRLGAGPLAAEIAVVVTERGLGGEDVDLTHRLENLRRDRSRRAADARRMAQRWAELAASGESKAAVEEAGASTGSILALAYPDRIAKSRGAAAAVDGTAGAFLLANGRGVVVDPASPLAREPFLAVAEVAGSAAQARILLAAPISLAEIEARFGGHIEGGDEMTFDSGSASLRARRTRRLGALALAEQTAPVSHGPETAQLLAQGLIRIGLPRLPWTSQLIQWRERVIFLRRSEGEEWPDLSDSGLAARADEWLLPLCAGKTALAEISPEMLAIAVTAMLPWSLRRRLDAEAPTHFAAPSGSQVAIDYGAEEGPRLSIRVQELFGLDRHPSIAAGRVPLILELLSPARRPVQITRDLPAFWRGSYAAVRSEMKGRYPKHPWPEDPLAAAATRHAKRRS